VFNDLEMQLLAALCDTLIPALKVQADPAGLYSRRASDLDLPALLTSLLETVVSPADRAQLRLVLNLFDQRAVNAVWGRAGYSFLIMDLDGKTALLRDWAESRVPARRKAFHVLKRLALFLFYSVLDSDKRNPNWLGLGYPGPVTPPAESPRPIKPMTLFEAATLETDVVIVGSGAGGGVVAGELAAAGLDVIVLEKGGYAAESDFDGAELRSQARLFEKQGFLTSADLGTLILAGSTLGGGTTINWAVAQRTPPHILQEWEDDYGLPDFTDQTYQDAQDAVAQRIHVTTDESEANARSDVLIRGGAALDYPVEVLPRNVHKCGDCGFCGFGCRFGAKQGTLRTYLQDAYTQGARIAVQTRVERVLIKNGRAVGVIALTQTPNGDTVRLIIKARAVVVAAGALHTPALLMRSGLTNAHIGRNLHLHPAASTFGFYEAPINGWEGVMLSHAITHFSDLDGNGHGVRLESAPLHPGFTASALPWLNGYLHKQWMARYAHLSNILATVRDAESGRITLDREGEPVVHYQLSAADGAHLMRGVFESLRIQQAAGADSLCGPTAGPGRYVASENQNFDEYLAEVELAGLRRHGFLLSSAHQMSSCRMAANPSRGAIDGTGQTFEVRDLYVADASALPTATGVGPTLTVMSVAYTIAQSIKARLVN
jgi:choline dehydrogenase-like flavoprotein